MPGEQDFLYEQIKLWIADGVSKKDLFDRLTILLSERRVSDQGLIKQLQGFAAKNWHLAAIDSKLQSNQELNTNERITAAFAALNKQGILAKQNFTCCGSCGHGEAYWAAKERQEQGLPSHGYAFYHQQDTESGVAGHGLHIAFGSLVDDDAARVAIGAEISQAFTHFGIDHDWNQSAGTRLYIKPFTWSRQKSPSGALLPIDKPWVIVGHSDGRVWAGRIQDGQLEVRVKDNEGDVSTKKPRAREPHQERQRMIQALFDDGFVLLHAKDLPALSD
jgi:hypothetical protein